MKVEVTVDTLSIRLLGLAKEVCPLREVQLSDNILNTIALLILTIYA